MAGLWFFFAAFGDAADVGCEDLAGVCLDGLLLTLVSTAFILKR